MALYGSSPEEIAYAAGILRRGGLVAFPTETVYGLGADASNERALAHIFAVKGRPADHPVIVHLAVADAMNRWARDIPASAWKLAERFWPGPLTMILKRAPGVSNAVTGGQDTVGLRVPDHPSALALLTAFGGGIAAPSANRFGRVSPTRSAHVIAEFGDAVECVIDGGSCRVGLESTILDFTQQHPQMLRPGAVMPYAMAEILGEQPGMRTSDGPRAPGCLPSHYAPDTPMRLVEAAAIETTLRSLLALAQSVAVLSTHLPTNINTACRWLRMPADAERYGRRLYATLREADTWGCHFILVEQPPASIEWEAIRDRLGRAAGTVSELPR